MKSITNDAFRSYIKSIERRKAMKVFKYSLMVLALAVVTNVTLARADITLTGNQKSIMDQTKLYYNAKSGATDAVVKDDLATQYFKNLSTFTTYTNPCNDCKIKAFMEERVNGTWSNVRSTKDTMVGEKKAFTGNTSESEGTFRIKMKRSDITAAWTYVTWEWIVKG